MLRGGYTIEIGWIVMLIVPVLFYIYFRFIQKDDGKTGDNGPYKDGKLSENNTKMLYAFLGFIALMVLLAVVFTPM